MQSLLFLVHRIPYPPNKGDKVRSYNMLKYLSRRYRVFVGAFVDDEADFEHEDSLRNLCERCHLVRLSPLRAKARSLTGLITGEPLTLPYYRSASMKLWVDNVLRTTSLQGVLVFSAAMAQYVMAARDYCRIADLVDVDSDKWRQYSAMQRWPYSLVYRRESRTLLQYERRIAREFDGTVFVSAPEAALFCQLAPESMHNVSHISNGVDCEYFSPERPYVNPYNDNERVLVFTGAMDYWPNVDAATAFAKEVFPAILSRNAAARFYIVGSRPTPEVRCLSALPGITVTGAVPDIRPYLAHAQFAVAPLRLARGVQNKVLEAMAMAKAVIASPQAAEGIECNAGAELIVADDMQAFIGHADRLLREGGAATIGAAGRAAVVRFYSWESSLCKFEQLLAREMLSPADVRCAPGRADSASDAAMLK